MLKGWRKEGLQDRLPWWNLGDSIEVHPPLGSNGFWMDGALVGAGSHESIQECSESFDDKFDVSCVTREKTRYTTRCSAKICILHNNPNQTSGAPNVVL
jgi:hypothetical protein